MSKLITILVFVVPVSIIGLSAFVTGEGGKKKKQKKEAKAEHPDPSGEQETAEATADFQEADALEGAEGETREQQQQAAQVQVPLPEVEGEEIPLMADEDLDDIFIEEGELFESWDDGHIEVDDFSRSVEFVSEEVAFLIDREIVQPIAAAKGVDMDVMSFSRCPSGMESMVLQKPASGNPFYYGIVVHYVGCSDDIQCKFRINTQNGQVGISTDKADYSVWKMRDMKQPGEEYVSVSTWLAEHSGS